MIEYYNEDCMVGMARYPDKHFDLAIVDPPYGLPSDSSNGRGKLKNRVFNQGGIADKWDIAPDNVYFNELFRVSNNQVIWGGNYFDLPPTRGIICWDKVQPWENFSQIEYAWTSFNVPAKLFRLDNRTGDKTHPTQKPIALYKWLLKNYAKQGDLILDTHVGSASSLIACYDMGFDAVGFELDPDYYKASKQRLDDFMRQPRIDQIVQENKEQLDMFDRPDYSKP